MLERFSDIALNEAREYYKEHDAKENVKNVLENGIDLDTLLVYVSNSIIWVPRIKEFFDEHYKTDKIKFYTTARNHELYNDKIFTDKNLEMEVSMRRTFGILLCGLEDEELLNKIISVIEKEYIWAKKLSKKFDKAEYLSKMTELHTDFSTKGKSPEQINAPIFIFLFLLFARNGYETRKTAVWEQYYTINDLIDARNKYDYEKVMAHIDRIDYNKNLVLTKEFRKLQDTIKTGGDFCYLLDVSELNFEVEKFPRNYINELDTILLNSCEDAFGESSRYYTILQRMMLLSDILEMNGLSIVEVLWNYKTDENERERLLKFLSKARDALGSPTSDLANGNNNLMGYFTAMGDVFAMIQQVNPELAMKAKESFFNSQKEMTEKVLMNGKRISTEDYILALSFDMLSKAIKHNRDFYFKNNSETEYYEIQKYQDKTADMELEIENFNSALSEKDKEIEFLKKQIEDLKNAESKEAKDIVKPYNEEISFLNKQVEDLKEKLSAEQEKTDELNKLRTFAFSVRSEDVVAEKEVSLSELIKDKKITIIGGHTNWQNKMKKKYPKLNLLDGHSTSFDLQTLTTSDFVLLYTGNMSHTVYYKMIDTLRTSGVKYDYIGKYNNVNLLEQEIAEILK